MARSIIGDFYNAARKDDDSWLAKLRIEGKVLSEAIMHPHWFNTYVKNHMEYCTKEHCKDCKSCTECEEFLDDVADYIGYNERVEPYDFATEEDYVAAVEFANDADVIAANDDGIVYKDFKLASVPFASKAVDPRDFMNADDYAIQLEKQLFMELLEEYPFIPRTYIWFSHFLNELSSTGSVYCATKEVLSLYADACCDNNEYSYDEEIWKRCQLTQAHETDQIAFYESRFQTSVELPSYRVTYDYWAIHSPLLTHDIDRLSSKQFNNQTLCDIITELKPSLKPLIDYVSNEHLSKKDLPRRYSEFFPFVLQSSIYFYEVFGFDIEESIQNGQLGLLKALKNRFGRSDDYPSFEDFIQEEVDISIIQHSLTVETTFGKSVDRKMAKRALTVLNYYAGNYERYTGRNDYYYWDWSMSLADRAYADAKLRTLFSKPTHDFVSLEDQPIRNEQFDLEITQAENRILRGSLLDILNTLTPREETILLLRFGLQDGHFHTLDEVAAYLNVSRERIRQIETHVFKKLRHKNLGGRLRDFLEDC